LGFELVAIDLDGTLLDSQHALPPRNREALHRAHAAGLKLVLCTGRAFTETRPVLAEIGLDLDAAVTVFGALITDVASGRTLVRSALGRDVAGAATHWMRAEGYPVLWLTDPDECGTDGYLLSGPRRHAAVDVWLQRSPCRVENVDALPDGCAAPVRLSIIDDPEPLVALSPRLAGTFDGRLVHNVLHAPPYRLSLIEAFAPQVSKWFGIETLCRRWGIDPQRTVAIGDDVNDLAMITHAGLGVAMGNARAEVRAAAQRVTDTNDACGVARVIEELLD
jgi:hydroxymethylpyrimidine pyrophosphatase-like HAD family hydrolase